MLNASKLNKCRCCVSFVKTKNFWYFRSAGQILPLYHHNTKTGLLANQQCKGRKCFCYWRGKDNHCFNHHFNSSVWFKQWTANYKWLLSVCVKASSQRYNDIYNIYNPSLPSWIPSTKYLHALEPNKTELHFFKQFYKFGSS